MNSEKKWSTVKILLLPVIVFLLMQYQIDNIKDEHAQIYYQERLNQVNDEIYRLELNMLEHAQFLKKELDHVFFEIERIKEGD